eukprot:13589510-Heterocapsa_arctica.AAC.1
MMGYTTDSGVGGGPADGGTDDPIADGSVESVDASVESADASVESVEVLEDRRDGDAVPGNNCPGLWGDGDGVPGSCWPRPAEE